MKHLTKSVFFSSASIAASTSSAVTQSATGNEFAVRITRPDGTFIDYNVLPNYGDYIKEVCKAGEVSDDVRSVPSIPAPPPSVRLHTRGVVRGQPAALAQGSEGRQAALTLYSDTSASLASTQASQQQTPRDTAADVLTGYVDLRYKKLILYSIDFTKAIVATQMDEMQSNFKLKMYVTEK